MTKDAEKLIYVDVNDPITELELILQQQLFHQTDETARAIINEYLLSNPILLIMKGREHYYKNF